MSCCYTGVKASESPSSSLALLFLTDTRRTVEAAANVWSVLTATTVGQRDTTAAKETARRHAIEVNIRRVKAVQTIEIRLNITTRWEPGTTEWEAAALKVKMRRYQRSIDVLEGLIVARMFELTKMNMSQTGMSETLASIVY
jgi:hypothetical protein